MNVHLVRCILGRLGSAFLLLLLAVTTAWAGPLPPKPQPPVVVPIPGPVVPGPEVQSSPVVATYLLLTQDPEPPHAVTLWWVEVAQDGTARFRAYDPVMGRWLSRDPIGERGGLNLYGYVGNGPVSNVDLMGLKVTVEFNDGTKPVIIPDDDRNVVDTLAELLKKHKNGSVSSITFCGHGQLVGSNRYRISFRDNDVEFKQASLEMGLYAAGKNEDKSVKYEFGSAAYNKKGVNGENSGLLDQIKEKLARGASVRFNNCFSAVNSSESINAASELSKYLGNDVRVGGYVENTKVNRDVKESRPPTWYVAGQVQTPK
jgi:hypothetical protein